MSERIAPGDIGAIRYENPTDYPDRDGKWVFRAALRLEWGCPTVDIQGSGPTKLKAEARLKANARRRYEKHQRGQDAVRKKDGPQYLADVLGSWNEEAVRRGHPLPQTQSEYLRIARADLIPALGHTPLSEITTGQINRALLAMTDPKRGGYSKAEQALASLRSILRWVMDEGIIESNPSAGAKPPHRPASAPRKAARALSPAEIARVISAAAAHDRRALDPHRPGKKPSFKLETGLRIMLGTGLRIGELLGLRWVDLLSVGGADFRCIEVNGTVIDKPAEGGPQDRWQPRPKTDASYRRILVGDVVANA